MYQTYYRCDSSERKITICHRGLLTRACKTTRKDFMKARLWNVEANKNSFSFSARKIHQKLFCLLAFFVPAENHIVLSEYPIEQPPVQSEQTNNHIRLSCYRNNALDVHDLCTCDVICVLKSVDIFNALTSIS